MFRHLPGYLALVAALLLACNDEPTVDAEAFFFRDDGSPLSVECVAHDIATLKSCAQSFANYDSIRFSADITCTNDTECCGSGNTALIRLHNLDGWSRPRTIDGGGHTLTRTAGQRSCSAISVSGTSSHITVSNLIIDENWYDHRCDNPGPCPGPNCCDASHDVGPCWPEADPCNVVTVDIDAPNEFTTTDIELNNIEIRDAKDTAVRCGAVA